MFYNNLNKACKLRNTTINAILKEIGQNNSGISTKWKNGAKPKIDIVSELATKLNVTTDYLIFGTETSDEDREITKLYNQLNTNNKTIVKAEMLKRIEKQNEEHLKENQQTG